jgi:hypothetical protein
MIDVTTAAKLLDFGKRIGDGPRAQEQLEGAVAIHNILAERGVAYLADEVGMGKTYVALGALALFRHFHPDFRVLIIAPRENIQTKWKKEFGNFVRNNVRYPDLRVKALDGGPTRPLVTCQNLLELTREVTLDSNRDFVLRLTSFSLPVGGKNAVDPGEARRFRKELREHLPWMRDEVFDLRNKSTFKDNIAKALCCALPPCHLVIVDEGHNLKHGFGENVSARNRVLGLAMGRSMGGIDRQLFPGYGPRATRVLFLSATPVEETYRHLWNQLNLFGRGKTYSGLIDPNVDEDAKKEIAAQFLIRRITTIQAGTGEYTKNLYRREWRRGGVQIHDEPIHAKDDKQRLVVALVQKKVSELLGHERFNSSFQIGMLASFESFLETTRQRTEEVDGGNFDDTEQTDDLLEREGIDVSDVNRLSHDYRKVFGAEMPHPKMDAIVESLAGAWRDGAKSLIFVRRVASVKELKRKLEERYDQWLMDQLYRGLPPSVHPRLRSVFAKYRSEKLELYAKPSTYAPNDAGPPLEGDDDQGGSDTFFAWFFRGNTPRGVISGANIQQRFTSRGAVYATFFADNYVARLLSCRPGEVENHLAQALQIGPDELRRELRERSRWFLAKGKKQERADRFEAVQAAAIEWLKDQVGLHQEQARVVWHQRFETSRQSSNSLREAPDIGNWLELPTFFTALRERESLRERLWPRSKLTDATEAFREREIRAQLLVAAARLGHPLIDLYIMTIRRLGNVELRAQESAEDGQGVREFERIAEYLDLLDKQRLTPRDQRDWGAFDELADLAENFELIIDVNLSEVGSMPLSETAVKISGLLRAQQPIGGMVGQVNQTLVRQFRMPGYPLVLITTDLLKEGEDLHTFCSSVHHYGIAWTPSSMEQRVGRIDRVRSHAERRLVEIKEREPAGEERLQVYFPHLEDTVEVLQVRRVLERMNVFMRLMHEGLTQVVGDERSIDAGKEFARGHQVVEQIKTKLESSFPIQSAQLGSPADAGALGVGPDFAAGLIERFAALGHRELPGVRVDWETPQALPGMLLGTAQLGDRVQPFSLQLRSLQDRPLVRCISPVGCVSPGEEEALITASAAAVPMRIGAILTRDERTYDLTVEGDVLLASTSETDAMRVAQLIGRVVTQADMLEQEHLPGHDERIDTFREELTKEGSHDH